MTLTLDVAGRRLTLTLAAGRTPTAPAGPPTPAPGPGPDDVMVPPQGAQTQAERAETWDHDRRQPIGFRP